MARSVSVIQEDTPAALKTAIDALLAPFVGGSSRQVIGFDIVQIDQDRQLNKAFIAIIVTDPAGAANLAGPFVFNYVEEGNAADLQTSLQAAYTTLAAHFTSGARNVTERTRSKLNRISAWFVSCSDAADGATNWAIK